MEARTLDLNSTRLIITPTITTQGMATRTPDSGSIRDGATMATGIIGDVEQ